MRIFTLGKNGIPLFFFALILFSGTYSSYGQCASITVNEPTQDFCDSERATVASLQASTTGDAVVWYSSSAEGATALSSGQFLSTGTYYAGTADGPCADKAVVVTVVGPPEILGVKATSTIDAQASLKQSLATIGICVADVNNPGVTVGDLRTNAPSEDDVSWFRTETGGTALATSTPLENGNYYVQYNDPSLNCSTTRRRTIVTLFSEAAPTGPAQQTFCEVDSPTLADIDASGNNRYYTAATGGAELSETTALEVGTATYYVSSFGETCESIERLAVTVTVNPLAITEEIQSFCESMGSGNDFFKPTVANLSPEGGVWYLTTDFETTVDPATELVEGQIYYLAVAEGSCETTEVTVDMFETPNAGSTTTVNNVCQSSAAFDLIEALNPSQLGEPSTNGTFSPALSTGTEMFNPADYAPGTHTFTYTVQGNENCPTDSSKISVVILESPNAGTDMDLEYCQAEIEAMFIAAASNPDAAEAMLFDLIGGDVSRDGVFNPTLEEIAEDYTTDRFTPGGLPNTYTTTYTVTDPDTGCESSSEISLKVNPSPGAADNVSIQLTETPNEVSLETALEGEATGGIWTDANNTTVEGTLVPQEAGVYTYTLTNEFGCSSVATVTFVAIPQDCPVVTDTVQDFCKSIGEGNNFDRPRVSNLQPFDALWYASADATEPLAANTLLEDGVVYYAGNESGDCVERPSVTVVLFDTPNAGSTTSVTFCSNADAVNLVDYMNDSQLGAPQYTGSFNNAKIVDNIFNPADFAVGKHTFTYTVLGNEDCPTDTAVITVTITAAPNAGADVSESFCVSSPDDLPSPVEFMAEYADDSRDQTGTFSPSLETLAAAFATNPYGTFATVYSVTTNGCTDTANLSVTVTQEEPADAGEDVAATVCSTAGVQNLSDFLTEDAISGGVFSAPYADGTFDPSTAGAEPVVITYTVNEDVACVTGEATSTITLTVIEGPNAGEDGSITLNVADAPVNLFDSLGGTPDEGGTWTPGNANGELDPSTLAAGEYTYVYTVTSANECEDTATITVTIEGEVTCPVITDNEQSFCESILTGNDSKLPTVSDLLPAGATWYASADATEALPATTVLVNGTTYYAGNSNGTCEARESVTVTLDDSPNAGSTTQVTFCESDEPIDLLDVLNPSILGEADLGGTFSPALASGTTIFDPAVDAAGTYTYTVESTNDVCPRDTAVITITVTPNANAGEEISLEFCATQEAADLTELLPDGVDTNGTFEGLEGNVFNPADFEVGSHEFNYTVTVTGACESTDTSVVTVVVTEAPAAPAAEAQSFCIVDGATVADLVAGAEGDNLLWYTDESLETLADETDALIAGTYYVTNTTEGGCESAAAAVVVTLTDTTAPSLTAGGNVFCEFNNPTLATLTANVTGGNITWYDAATGGNALTSTQPLQNGVTYYAASTDATSACESSVRLAVTVDLGDCPVIIPDAFSPNGDGINDRFEISYIADEFPNYTIEIFNRWGNVVFKGNASTPNWDGVSTESRSLGDKVLPVGVYFYIVNYNDGQTAPTQGRLYLSR